MLLVNDQYEPALYDFISNPSTTPWSLTPERISGRNHNEMANQIFLLFSVNSHPGLHSHSYSQVSLIVLPILIEIGTYIYVMKSHNNTMKRSQLEPFALKETFGHVFALCLRHTLFFIAQVDCSLCPDDYVHIFLFAIFS